jgi:thioester reductase-like protein
MTWSIPRITTGAERRLLESMLDRNRAELINTVRGLSEAEARRRLVASPTTPIGLLKHAAVAERIWFQHVLAQTFSPSADLG